MPTHWSQLFWKLRLYKSMRPPVNLNERNRVSVSCITKIPHNMELPPSLGVGTSHFPALLGPLGRSAKKNGRRE